MAQIQAQDPLKWPNPVPDPPSGPIYDPSKWLKSSPTSPKSTDLGLT